MSFVAVGAAVAGSVATGLTAKVLGGGGGKSGSAAPSPPDPLQSLAALGNLKSKDNSKAKMADTKVAKAVGADLPKVPGSTLDDPWKPAQDMYTDLGGDADDLPALSSYWKENV
jgi:hypothetical protein